MPKTSKGKTTILKVYGKHCPERLSREMRATALMPRVVRKPYREPVQTSVKTALSDGYDMELFRV